MLDLTVAAGTAALSMVPIAFGIAGYVLPIVFMTAGYGVFQAANNTAVMSGSSSAERGVVSGMLNMSRNLGLVTGASAMGAVFAWGTGSTHVVSAEPFAVAPGAHASFATATVLVGLALVISFRATRGDQQLRKLENAS